MPKVGDKTLDKQYGLEGSDENSPLHRTTQRMDDQ